MKVVQELQNQGLTINHKKVKRLMSIMRLYRITSKARYKSNKRDMNGAVANHLLDIKVDPTTCKTLYERDFDTVSCNEKWSANISEFHIASGKLYFSPILDLHN